MPRLPEKLTLQRALSRIPSPTAPLSPASSHLAGLPAPEFPHRSRERVADVTVPMFGASIRLQMQPPLAPQPRP
jgi:hypothetical protein